jgi:Bax protein
MPKPHTKQTGNALIGYLFIGYALFTLALTLYLSGMPSSNPKVEQAVIEKTVTAQKSSINLKKSPPAPSKPVKAEAPSPVAQASAITMTSENYPKRPDFGAIRDVKTKKDTFFLYLLPAIKNANDRMLRAQQQLAAMQNQTQAGQALSAAQQETLTLWSKQYRADAATTTEQIAQLLERMDEIPASMVLAQGAMESAWGTSRFARLANNYFGQWCFSKGCGIVPSQRNSGASHEVATFSDAHAAVAAYFKNINRHPAYQRVRDERSALRKADKTLDSLVMVRGLDKYSARGHAYIEELQSMIRYNKIKRFD